MSHTLLPGLIMYNTVGNGKFSLHLHTKYFQVKHPLTYTSLNIIYDIMNVQFSH